MALQVQCGVLLHGLCCGTKTPRTGLSAGARHHLIHTQEYYKSQDQSWLGYEQVKSLVAPLVPLKFDPLVFPPQHVYSKETLNWPSMKEVDAKVVELLVEVASRQFGLVVSLGFFSGKQDLFSSTCCLFQEDFVPDYDISKWNDLIICCVADDRMPREALSTRFSED